MDVMGDNRTYSPAYGVSGGAATHYSITTDGNAYPNPNVTTVSANLAGYPLAFDVVVGLNGSGVAAWGSPGWSVVSWDSGSPTNSLTVTETVRDASSITLHVSATNFADLFGWTILFDGTQTVDALTPAFIAEIAGSGIFLFPVMNASALVDQSTLTASPFLFDPTGAPPSFVIAPTGLLTGQQWMPPGEAGFVSAAVTLTVQDGGTGAVSPFISAVSSDPADGWLVDLSSGDYTGYEYEANFVVNGDSPSYLVRIKDMNLP